MAGHLQPPMEPPVDPPGIPFSDGRIPFRHHSTWYCIYGGPEQPGKLPLLCLHGGPGAGYESLATVKAMALTGRRVIFYDQLGCGRSSLSEPHPEMWTIPLFVDEVAAVRQALGLDRIHLLGHSWGGMLALEYMFTRPGGVASLTLASAPISMPQWASEANRLLDDMPPEVGETVRRHEVAGTIEDPEYMAAMAVFRARHFAPRRPQPALGQGPAEPVPANPEVNLTMYGPLVFDVRGTLKDWDVHERLGEVDVPTLVTSGRFDMATPAIARAAHDGIPGSELFIFDESAHVPHADEPELYMDVLGDFLTRHEP